MHWLQPGNEIADVLEPYRSVRRTPRAGRPWVVANMVCDLTGSTTIDGRVGALSSGADVELFRRLRSVGDVVLVGAETVRRERYGPAQINPRDAAPDRPPPPIAVVSRSLGFDWTIPLFTASGGTRPILITCEGAHPDAVVTARDHADVLVAGDESVEMGEALHGLAEHGAAVVVCEGGPHVLGELVAAGCVDELCLTIAPLMGGDPLPVAVLPAGSGLHGFRLAQVLEDEGTLLLRYEREPSGGS